MEITRRKFIKDAALAAGAAAAAVGGIKLIPGIFSASEANAKNTKNERSQNQNTETAQAWEPGYLKLEKSGELERREKLLFASLENCELCPRKCGINRAAGVMGTCATANDFKVASFGPHFGEEVVFRGNNGSGTIFFSNCSLLCVFCINYQIAHHGEGRATTHNRLANMMLDLQRRGCHNINLVSPTHVLPHIIRALRLAIPQGLRLPILYNSSGYDMIETIKLLDGIVDIYLPDFKYQDSDVASRFSQGAIDYPARAAETIKEMHRQVGTLQTANGIAQRGLLIRHLVMPQNLAGTDVFVRWVANELGAQTHVNIMSQYTPMFRANDFPPLDRRLTSQEFAQAMDWAREAGLRNFH